MQSTKHQHSKTHEFNFRPMMAQDESLAGYLLRFAEANVLAGLRGVARFAGLDPWDLFGRDRLALARLLWGEDAENRSDYRVFCEARGPERYGAGAFRRVCIMCLQKSSSRQALSAWDEPMSTHCKAHRVLLTTTCSFCRLPLDYMRDQGVSRCSCGATLEEQQPSAIPYWLPFIHFVLDPASCTKPIDDMSADATAAQILQQIASLSPEARKAAIDPDLLGHPLATQDAITLSQSWFNNWPQGFSDSLSKRGYRTGIAVPTDVARLLGQDNFPEIRRAIERHEQVTGFTVVRRKPKAIGTQRTTGQIGKPEVPMVVHYPLAFVPMRFPLRVGATKGKDGFTHPPEEQASESGEDGMVAKTQVPELAGMLPHLVLMWLTTRTLERSSPAGDLTWSDLVRFASQMGFSSSSGGSRGSMTRLRAALVGLLATDVSDLVGDHLVSRHGVAAGEPVCIGAGTHEQPYDLAAGPIVVSPWFEWEVCTQTCTIQSRYFRVLKGSRIAQLLYILVQARIRQKKTLIVSLGEIADFVGMASNSPRRRRQTMLEAIRHFNARRPEAMLGVDGDEVHILPDFDFGTR